VDSYDPTITTHSLNIGLTDCKNSYTVWYKTDKTKLRDSSEFGLDPVKNYAYLFLEEAEEFISELDLKMIKKIFYNIDLAEQTNDPKLFKKLQNDIWEFRTKYAGIQIRLLAFWDKTDNKKTLVLATHGLIKKIDKVPANEIDRAARLRVKYFENK
jgi:phage-related protein